jgi:glycosyltransferase involved in cell wall biosynthesis
MAAIYSSFDVLLAASAGEGFGIPVIEAQACGVPVIVSDFSAQPELVGAGWVVKGQRQLTPIKAWQFRPDVVDIHDALRRAYAKHSGSMREKCRAFALQYDADRVMTEYMLPALAEAEDRFRVQEPVTIAPREAVAA